MSFENKGLISRRRGFYKNYYCGTKDLKVQAWLFWIALFLISACNIAYLLVRVFYTGVPANSAAVFVFIFIYCGVCAAMMVYNIINKLKITQYKQCAIASAIVFAPMLVFIIYFGCHGINIVFPVVMIALGIVAAVFRCIYIRLYDLGLYCVFSAAGIVFAILTFLLGMFVFSGTDRRTYGKLGRNVTYDYSSEEGYTVKKVWRTLGPGAKLNLSETVRRKSKDVPIVGIDGEAFTYYDHELLHLPSTVTRIDDNAFSNSGIRRIEAVGGMKVEIFGNAFSNSEVSEFVTDRADVVFNGALGNVDGAFTVRLDRADSRLSFDKTTVGENVIFEVNKEKIEDFRSDNAVCADRFVPIVDEDELYVTVNDGDGGLLDGIDTVIEKVGQADSDGKHIIALTIPDTETRRTKTVDGVSRDEQLVFVGKDKSGAQAQFLADATEDGEGNRILNIATESSLRLYAAWSPIYSVKFDTESADAEFVGEEFDGADIEFYNHLDDSDNIVKIPSAADIRREGYAFIGWYKKGSYPREYYGEYNGFDEQNVKTVTDNLEEDLELVADFRKYYNVVFNGMGADFDELVAGGKVVLPDKLTDGCKYHGLSGEIILPDVDDTSRPGFEFDGWYTSANYTWRASNIAARSAGDKIFYARWTLKSPTVTAINYIDKFYDGKAHEVGVNAKHDCSDVSMSFSWKGASSNSAAVTEVKNAGSYSYSVTATASLNEEVTYCSEFNTDGSKNNSSRNLTYRKQAAPVNVTADISPVTLNVVWDDAEFVYDGTERTLSAHKQSDPISGESPQINIGGNKATNAGTYTASATCSDRNYVISAATKTHKWQIAKADYDMSHVIFADAEFVYDGARHSPTVTESSLPTGAASGDAPRVGSYSRGALNVSDGRKAVTASFIPSPNYNTPSPMTAYVTITARPITVKADDKTSVYGSDIVALSAKITSGNIVGGDVNPWSLSTAASKTSRVGTYDIVGSGNNDNYSVTVNKGTYTITARPITVKADDKTSVYGSDIVALSAKITSGSIVGGDVSPWSLSTAASKTSRVGTYDIVGSGNNDNYSVTVNKGTYTITARALASGNVVLTQNSLTYDGSAKTPTVTVSVSGKNLIRGTDYTVSYAENINVGTAAITVRGIGNYGGTVSKSFSITKADAPVAWGEWVSDGSGGYTVTASINANGNTVIPNVSVSSSENADGSIKYTATASFSSAQGSYSRNYNLTNKTSTYTYTPELSDNN